MTMTDPIADMLTRLRNANSAYHEQMTMPSSKIKTHIAEILQQEGYIAGWRVQDNEDGVGSKLLVDLKYGPNRERSIAGVRRVSKPGLRVYAKSSSLPRVLGGLGHRDHLDVHRAAHRPAGCQEGRRRGSPRLRLVSRGGEHTCRESDDSPSPFPRAWTCSIDGREVTVKGPKGTLSHTVARPDRDRSRRGRHASR